MAGRVLVAGFSTRHVVQSARRAGWETCAIDHFCDQDLGWFTRDRIRFEELDEIPDAIQKMCARHRIDYLVLTSGAEQITADLPVLGTPAPRIERFLDKRLTQQFFESEHIPTPALAGEKEFPLIIKPRRGAGGWRNRRIANETELTAWREAFPGVPALLQRQVDGLPASVSCITDGRRAVAVGINEQILRDQSPFPFGFAGSITPLSHPETSEMIALAERAAGASGCVGSVGVDFVLGERPWAIEINPRFQATIDTVERATGRSIFDLHVRACQGDLPAGAVRPIRYAARRILFADRSRVIREDLSGWYPRVADIPWPGTRFEEGQAMISVLGEGSTRAEALDALNKNITGVCRYIQR